MKTRLILSILLACIISNLYSQQWEYIDKLHGEWFRKICTQGPDTVYIVGNKGLIARSPDRALTWTKQYPVTTKLNDIVFFNHTEGVVVGDGGVILKTTDAGDTWTQVPSGTTENLNAAAVSGLNGCWIVGDNGNVLYATDKGGTWLVKDLSIHVKLNDVSFRDNIGYVVGNNSIRYKTNDNGNNWIEEKPFVEGGNFDFLSVDQGKNNTYFLYGPNLLLNNTLKPADERLTCFKLLNDSIGHGGFANITTNGVSVIRIIKYKWGNYEYDLFGNANQNTPLDNSNSDIIITEDTTGYFISGMQLYQLTKKPSAGLESQYSNDITITQRNNTLTIATNTKHLSDIKIISLSGSNILQQQLNEVRQAIIDVKTLPKGVYVLRVGLTNNEYFAKKWIKE